MRQGITIILLTLMLTAQAVGQAEPVEYIEVEPAADLTELRVLTPPRVHTQTIPVRFEAPADWVGRTVTATIKDNDQIKATGELEAVRGRPSRQHPRGKIESSRATLTLNVDKLDDGEYAVAYAVLDGDKTTTEGTAAFTIVADQLAEVEQAHRKELSTWLADDARQEPIWGKIPTWPNLEEALEQGAEGDPYRGLRRFMLRAYYNPQLRRMQPYTVYVPESLDLEKPAPLMILLHGSGGDYRNLIADYAAGQRLEEHPMLIANAGAFAHQEFRHMALNDVRWIIEDMKRKYNVDADRIYCQGISLGGRGAIELAARMPDTFAAISPQGVYGIHPTLINPEPMLHRDPLAVAIESRADIRSLLPAMAHVPTEIVFGWDDDVTPPANALLIHKVMQHTRRPLDDRAGELVLRGFEAGHNITVPQYDWATTRKWMLTHTRRDTVPTPTVDAPAESPWHAAASEVGPIWTIWSEPVVFVYDDSGDAKQTALLKRSAEMSAQLDTTFGEPTLPVIPASEFIDEITAHGTFNAVWFTGAGGVGQFDVDYADLLPDELVDTANKKADVMLALMPGKDAKGKTLLVEIRADRPVSLQEFGWWDAGFYVDWVLARTLDQNQRRRRGGVQILAGGFYDADHKPTDRYTTEDWRGPGVMR